MKQRAIAEKKKKKEKIECLPAEIVIHFLPTVKQGIITMKCANTICFPKSLLNYKSTCTPNQSAHKILNKNNKAERAQLVSQKQQNSASQPSSAGLTDRSDTIFVAKQGFYT